MERVLITGGAGYIGSVLTRHLLNKGFQVTALDNLMYSQKSLFNYCDNPNFDFVFGDVRNEALVKSILPKFDVIIPLAAIVGMPACNDKPTDTVSINKDAVLMLDQLRSKNQKLIYPTTNSGYGAKSGDIFCNEETPLEPISLYGRVKSEAETTLLKSKKESITLRLATVFGISPSMRTDLLIKYFVLKAVTDKYIVLFEKDFKRNYIHIKDIARCFEHCINKYDLMKGRPYNVGLDSANLSKQELVEKVKSFVSEFVIKYDDLATDLDKRNYVVSSKRIMDTGFKPNHSLEEGIQELLKGYKILLRNNPYKTV